MEELEPDAQYDEEDVHALLTSGDGNAKGSVSCKFEWSIEYDFDRQATSKDAASLLEYAMAF